MWWCPLVKIWGLVLDSPKFKPDLGTSVKMSPIYLTSLCIFLICNKNVNRKSICLIKLDRLNRWTRKNVGSVLATALNTFPPPFPLCFSFLFTITCLLSSAGNNTVEWIRTSLNLSYKIWVWCSTLHYLSLLFLVHSLHLPWNSNYTFPPLFSKIYAFLLTLSLVVIHLVFITHWGNRTF